MLNPAAIVATLQGLVGWRPTGDNTGALHLPDELLESRSMLYMQDVSELLTLPVLQHITPKGEALGAWLLRVQTNALRQLVPALAAAQGLSGKVLLADGLAANGEPQGLSMLKAPGRAADTVNKTSRFVGLELTATRYAGVTYQLPAVSVQFDAVLSEPLTLYLYSDQGPDPEGLVVIPAGVNRPYYPYVVALDEALDITFAADYGGKAWLGYYEDELPDGVHAIGAPVTPCGCANDPWPKYRPWVQARPFAVAADYAAVSWNDEAIQYEGGSYGLNLFLLGYCDVATALQSQANQVALAPLVQQAVAIRLLEAIYTSPNLTQLASRPDVQADALGLYYQLQAQLYGGKVPGTDAAYPSALEKLTLDLTGLDKVCQAQPKQRISMGSLTTRR
jgi:hypothetical protein